MVLTIRNPQYRYIIIHHSATQDTEALVWKALWDYHVKIRGWQDIGYHYIIDRVNGDYVALVGRPEHIQGAHVRGFNHCSIGVCCVGNYSMESPNPQMLQVLVNRVLRPLMHRYEIGLEEVLFHRDVAATECPGKLFTHDILTQVLTESG